MGDMSTPHWRRALAQNAARVRADVSFALIDAFIIAMAYVFGLVARFAEGLDASAEWWPGLWRVLPMVVLIHLLANVIFGAYGHVWEYASVAEAMRVAFAAVAAGTVVFSTLVIARDAFNVDQPIPMGVVLTGAMFALLGMGAVRFRSRMFSLKKMSGVNAPSVRALIVGVGRPAAVLARQAPELKPVTDVVGFVTLADGTRHARRLVGLPVWSGLDLIPDLVDTYDIDQVIVATEAPDSTLRALVDACVSVDVALRIVPDLNALLTGHVAEAIRNIEVADLLPRPTVHTDLSPVADMLEGRRIMVTGAGGSIGSEIVKQCLQFAGTTVFALDNDETHLHDAMPEWMVTGRTPTPVLCDVRDASGVSNAFERYRPEVVFHAAAHKHVPILEECPEEAVKTNVTGTENVVRAARKLGVRRFVLISTDKAVDPSSVMGATKRIAEMLIQSACDGESSGGIYSAVRFGNVLGSRGSVVPTFMRQIESGGPVTVTDPRMSRYFMTIPEAVQLVLQAGAMASGGEVFVLDMGEPVKIIDLASRLIRLSGMVPGRDVDIEIVGMRPGEKLEETLSAGPLVPSAHPQINKASLGEPDKVALNHYLHLLRDLADSGERHAVAEIVHSVARSAQPIVVAESTGLRDVATWS